MKNTALKVLLIMTIVSSIFLCVLLFVLFNKGEGDGDGVSKLKEYQDRYEERQTDSKTIAPQVYTDFSKSEGTEDLYNTDRHAQVYERIEALKRDEVYTKDTPLVIYNPYGTNAFSVYVYFITETPVRFSYRVSVQEDIPTFAASCRGAESYATEHEYLLIGISPDRSNRVSMTMEDEEGNACVRTFYVTAGSQFGAGKMKLDVGKGVSEAKLSEGLFAHFGNRSEGRETIQLYDNDGVLRSEFPLLGGSAKRLLFFEDRVYYNISDTQFVALNSFGRADRVYSIEGYTVGKDFCLEEGQKKLLVLASKNAVEGKTPTVDDCLISVDLISGEVKEVLDMGLLLDEYKGLCEKNEEGVLNWLGLNSVQVWNNGSVLLGAREPSAAFKVKDIYGIPMLDYIIGEEAIFEGTGYEGYLLSKEEEFEGFAGANTFTVVREEGMPEGVYYLYLYDNHIAGAECRPELDYSDMVSDLGSSLKKGTNSFFCRYSVNEVARTWEQLEATPVDYSGYYGGAQLTAENHLITDTAGRLTYSEYDENRVLIRKYTAAGAKYLERVFKYDFKGFFFAGSVSDALSAIEEE